MLDQCGCTYLAWFYFVNLATSHFDPTCNERPLSRTDLEVPGGVKRDILSQPVPTNNPSPGSESRNLTTITNSHADIAASAMGCTGGSSRLWVYSFWPHCNNYEKEKNTLTAIFFGIRVLSNLCIRRVKKATSILLGPTRITQTCAWVRILQQRLQSFSVV